MDLVWEWQKTNTLKPRCWMTYADYQELVEGCGCGAWTWDRGKDELDELLDRLERVCP